MRELKLFIVVVLFVLAVNGCKEKDDPVEPTTKNTSTVTYGGKIYNTVTIGNQVWLKENLDIGTMITGTKDQTNNSTIEKYCYNNDPANCTTYGGLYQWAEAVQYKNGATNSTSPNPAFSGNVQGICPDGWHIPTLAEVKTLTSSLNTNNGLKAIGQGSGSGAGTNTTGFSALISGYRETTGTFTYSSVTGYLYSSTEYSPSLAATLAMNGADQTIGYPTDNGKIHGFSIRCIKD